MKVKKLGPETDQRRSYVFCDQQTHADWFINEQRPYKIPDYAWVVYTPGTPVTHRLKETDKVFILGRIHPELERTLRGMLQRAMPRPPYVTRMPGEGDKWRGPVMVDE